jgi:hypothetical protein
MTVLNDCAGALEGLAEALARNDQAAGLGSALGCVFHRMTDVLEEVEGQRLKNGDAASRV